MSASATCSSCSPSYATGVCSMSATRALAELARKLVALPGDERGVMLQAAALLPAVWAVQRSLPFKRWRPLLTRRIPHAAKSLTPDAIAQAVDRARRGVPGVYTC